VSLTERDLRCAIVEVGRRLYARGLIGGNEGNISVRQGQTLLVTPAGVCKGFLTPEEIVRTVLDHRSPLSQKGKLALHRAVVADFHRQCPGR
jgi:L-fuculose-phosphate aldolase